MQRRLAPVMAACLWLAGCQSWPAWSLPDLEEKPNLEMVRPSSFGGTGVTIPQGKWLAPTADSAVAVRADVLGRKILAANPEIGQRVLFATYRLPTPELFHQGTSVVHITEGLVQRCDTDAKLAAVLSWELAELVADRELLAHPRMRRAEPPPPLEDGLHNASHPREGDFVGQAQLAKYEKQRQDARKKLERPDPDKLARGYLDKAGFAASDLDTVKPLINEARKNFQLERALRSAEATPDSRAVQAAAVQAAEMKRTAPPPAPPDAPPPPPPLPPGLGTTMPQVIPLGR